MQIKEKKMGEMDEILRNNLKKTKFAVFITGFLKL